MSLKWIAAPVASYGIAAAGGVALVLLFQFAAILGWDFGFSQLGINVVNPDPVEESSARGALFGGYLAIVFVIYTTALLAFAGAVALILWNSDNDLGVASLVIVGVAALAGAIASFAIEGPAVPGGIYGASAATTALIGGSIALAGAAIATVVTRVRLS